MIDIKVTKDNNWVLVNHELTNSELDPIPNDDDANSGMNRLDVIYVGDKTSPVKVASGTTPSRIPQSGPAVYCDWDGAVDFREECSLFYSERTLIRDGRGGSGHSTRGPRYSTSLED